MEPLNILYGFIDNYPFKDYYYIDIDYMGAELFKFKKS